MGVGYARLRELWQLPGAEAPSLDLREVHATLDEVKTVAGGGSGERRMRLLGGLLGRATAAERDFLLRLLVGELRQGALEGVVIDAVARAFTAEPAAVRRAVMLAGTLPPVAAALAREGGAGLARFDLQLFSPIQPMLADSAPDVSSALEWLGDSGAGFEYKLDGARVQVHKDGDRVEVWSRQLNRVTPAVPETGRAGGGAARPPPGAGRRGHRLRRRTAARCPSRSPCGASAAGWTWIACGPSCRWGCTSSTC